MLVTEKEAFLKRIENREREVQRQFSFLSRLFTPRTVFLHFGAHDCALALKAATYVERVYAVDVAEGITDGVRLPVNLRFVASRNLWTVADGAIDVSFSERLPAARLGDVHRCLARRGIHVFQASDDAFLREPLLSYLRGAGFSAFKKHWLANLLHQPKLMTAHK